MSRFFTGIFGVIIVCVALPVYASTISLSSSATEVKKGQVFTVTVRANPDSAKAYTIKADIAYPAALLEITGFSFGSGWMPLSAAGYDTVDNVGGKLVKTAGFPGGFLEQKTLGTITFSAKGDGVATISVTNASIVYDAQNKNTISGTQGSATITINTPTPAPSKQQEPVPTGKKQVVAKPAVSPKTVVSEPEPTSTEEVSVATSTQVAAAEAASGTFASVISWVSARWTLVLLCTVLVLVLAVYYWRRRRSFA